MSALIISFIVACALVALAGVVFSDPDLVDGCTKGNIIYLSREQIHLQRINNRLVFPILLPAPNFKEEGRLAYVEEIVIVHGKIIEELLARIEFLEG